MFLGTVSSATESQFQLLLAKRPGASSLSMPHLLICKMGMVLSVSTHFTVLLRGTCGLRFISHGEKCLEHRQYPIDICKMKSGHRVPGDTLEWF